MIWVVDYNKKGRPFLFGPYISEVRAQKYIDDNLSSRAELFDLTTTNRSEATRQLKAKFVDKLHDLDSGTKRFRHSVKEGELDG